MAAANPTLILREAKSDVELAKEVLEGRLQPKLHRRQSGENGGNPFEDDEEGEEDELFVQIRSLLSSALESGKLRSLARAVVLAWQANYAGPLLVQAEPKMEVRAKEILLKEELKEAAEKRDRILLTDRLQRAKEAGLREATVPELRLALQVEKELEEETRNMQNAARPDHTKLMNSVIGEMSNKMFGIDVEKLQEEVEKEAKSAEEAFGRNQNNLNESLAKLKEYLGKPTTNDKLNVLMELHAIFQELNPRNLAQAVENLSSQVDDLRADNAQLMLAMRKSDSRKSQIVTLSATSGNETTLHGESAAKEVENLRARVAELEDNEQVLKTRIEKAAQVGAQWMEEKKNAEIELLKKENSGGSEEVRKKIRQEVEEEVRQQVGEELVKLKKSKVTALQGLEQNLTKKHQQETASLRMALEAAEMKVKNLEKVVKLRG